MYGGKHMAEGDTVFVFASENEGGKDLVARGVVISAAAVAKKRGIARQTLRVSVTIRRTAPCARHHVRIRAIIRSARPAACLPHSLRDRWSQDGANDLDFNPRNSTSSATRNPGPSDEVADGVASRPTS
jgi:hypothetical protein